MNAPFCFECGEKERHFRWCSKFDRPVETADLRVAPRPIDYTESSARARSTDPETSHAAAASVWGMTETKRRILGIVSACPSTDFEIRRAWDDAGLPRISDSGLRTRRSELVDDGFLVDSGERRAGDTGRAFIVWTAHRVERPNHG